MSSVCFLKEMQSFASAFLTRFSQYEMEIAIAHPAFDLQLLSHVQTFISDGSSLTWESDSPNLSHEQGTITYECYIVVYLELDTRDCGRACWTQQAATVLWTSKQKCE